MTYPLEPKRRLHATDFAFGKVIGTGCLSMVSVGVHKDTGKSFAVKVLDRSSLRSQKKEADVVVEEHCLRRLNHPGIVKLFGTFRDEGSHYFVLEHCPGGELWDVVKDVGCEDRRARQWLSQVIEAVSYLRDARVVHRDIKAENVMLGACGTCKLIDFGTAKDLHNPQVKGSGTPGAPNKPPMEDHVGTVNFMSPQTSVLTFGPWDAQSSRCSQGSRRSTARSSISCTKGLTKVSCRFQLALVTLAKT